MFAKFANNQISNHFGSLNNLHIHPTPPTTKQKKNWVHLHLYSKNIVSSQQKSWLFPGFYTFLQTNNSRLENGPFDLTMDFPYWKHLFRYSSHRGLLVYQRVTSSLDHLNLPSTSWGPSLPPWPLVTLRDKFSYQVKQNRRPWFGSAEGIQFGQWNLPQSA